jgi:hypothetical protein
MTRCQSELTSSVLDWGTSVSDNTVEQSFSFFIFFALLFFEVTLFHEAWVFIPARRHFTTDVTDQQYIPKLLLVFQL